MIHASADNRSELYVNGTRVLEGPDRGDLDRWRYETLDLAPYLRARTNTLAAVVWNFAERAPMAQMTNETGFIVQGDTDAESMVNTDSSWKSLRDLSRTMIAWNPRKVAGYFVVGPGERVGRDNSFSGINKDTADLTGNPVRPAGVDPVQVWFNPAAFSVNAVGTFGNVGRNSLRGPGLARVEALPVRSRCS